MYLFWSQVQVHTSNIIRKLTSFVRGIKVGYTYCCNQRVFFTFFRGRNQRCMNQNQFWCQNVFKDVKLSNLIFPLVRVQQTYRNCDEYFRLIKLRRQIRIYKMKIKDPLFNHTIGAFKIKNCIVEPKRTSNKKLYSDFVNCTLLPKSTEICFIDNSYHQDMVQDKIYYIQPRSYYHNITLSRIIDRFYNSFSSRYWLTFTATLPAPTIPTTQLSTKQNPPSHRKSGKLSQLKSARVRRGCARRSWWCGGRGDTSPLSSTSRRLSRKSLRHLRSVSLFWSVLKSEAVSIIYVVIWFWCSSFSVLASIFVLWNTEYLLNFFNIINC